MLRSKSKSDSDYFPKTLYLFHSRQFPSTINSVERLDDVQVRDGDNVVVATYELKKVGKLQKVAKWIDDAVELEQ